MSKIVFGIYIAGSKGSHSPEIAAFQVACKEWFGNTPYEINIIDVLKNPAEAERKKILAVPTYVLEKPAPEKRIIGDIRKPENARKALQFLTEDIKIKKNEEPA